MDEYIHQSNLIEGIDDPKEDINSLRAWEYLTDEKFISISVLLDLHKRITYAQLPKSESGRFRKVNVTVGGRVCPAPFLAEQLIYNWLLDLMQGYGSLDPMDMHVRFEKIHPFVDGNGRTGRMLMWWHELMLNREPTLINFDDREQYYQLFREGE